MEIPFEMSVEGEEGGWSTQVLLEKWVQDPKFTTMRYVFPLASGDSERGHAPMRTALMEFKSYNAWADFNTRQMIHSHILFDIFWLNTRRYIWEADSELSVFGHRAEDDKGGFYFMLRFSLDPATEEEARAFLKAKLPGRQMISVDGFIERRSFSSGMWQNHYTNLLWYEFHNLPQMFKHTVNNPKVMNVLEEAKERFFVNYAIELKHHGFEGGARVHRGENPRFGVART